MPYRDLKKRWDVPVCEKCGEEHRMVWPGYPGRGRPSCSAHRSKRDPTTSALQPCRNAPLRGLKVCHRHGGLTRMGKEKRARAIEEAAEAARNAADAAALERAVIVFGISREVNPVDGLLESYWRSAGIVTRLEGILAGLSMEELSWGRASEREESTRTDVKGAEELGGDALNGQAIEVKTVITRAARPHPALVMFDRERDRFERLGIEISKLNLEQRRDAYIAAQVDTLMSVLGPAQLTPEQRQIIAEGLRRLGQPRQIEGAATVDAEVVDGP